MKYRLKSDHRVVCEPYHWMESRSKMRSWTGTVYGEQFTLSEELFDNLFEPVPEEKPEAPIEDELERAADTPLSADFWVGLDRPKLLRRAAAEIRRLKRCLDASRSLQKKLVEGANKEIARLKKESLALVTEVPLGSSSLIGRKIKVRLPDPAADGALRETEAEIIG